MAAPGKRADIHIHIRDTLKLSLYFLKNNCTIDFISNDLTSIFYNSGGSLYGLLFSSFYITVELFQIVYKAFYTHGLTCKFCVENWCATQMQTADLQTADYNKIVLLA